MTLQQGGRLTRVGGRPAPAGGVRGRLACGEAGRGGGGMWGDRQGGRRHRLGGGIGRGDGDRGQEEAPIDFPRCLCTQGAPALPRDKFSAEFCDFISKCLLKDAQHRPSVQEMSR